MPSPTLTAAVNRGGSEVYAMPRGCATYTRDLLTETAAVSTGLVDMLRRLGTPVGSRSRHYLDRRLRHYGIDTTHFVVELLPERPRHAYPREALEEAAAACHSIREMVDYLGAPLHNSSYSHIRRKLDRFGIDTSHFLSGRRYGPSILPRAEISAAVAASHSVAGVLRVMGRSAGRVNRRLVQRSIKAYCLPTDHFLGQAHSRGRPSPARRSADDILKRLDVGSRRTKAVLLRRALDEKRVPRQCAACGLGDSWQGKRLVLEVDHINGDRLDNRLVNLRYLCPSCHSQTRTFSRRPSSHEGSCTGIR